MEGKFTYLTYPEGGSKNIRSKDVVILSDLISSGPIEGILDDDGNLLSLLETGRGIEFGGIKLLNDKAENLAAEELNVEFKNGYDYDINSDKSLIKGHSKYTYIGKEITKETGLEFSIRSYGARWIILTFETEGLWYTKEEMDDNLVVTQVTISNDDLVQGTPTSTGEVVNNKEIVMQFAFRGKVVSSPARKSVKIELPSYFTGDNFRVIAHKITEIGEIYPELVSSFGGVGGDEGAYFVDEDDPSEESGGTDVKNHIGIASYTLAYELKQNYPLSAIVNTAFTADSINSMPSRGFMAKGRMIDVPETYSPVWGRQQGLIANVYLNTDEHEFGLAANYEISNNPNLPDPDYSFISPTGELLYNNIISRNIRYNWWGFVVVFSGFLRITDDRVFEKEFNIKISVEANTPAAIVSRLYGKLAGASWSADPEDDLWAKSPGSAHKILHLSKDNYGEVYEIKFSVFVQTAQIGRPDEHFMARMSYVTDYEGEYAPDRTVIASTNGAKLSLEATPNWPSLKPEWLTIDTTQGKSYTSPLWNGNFYKYPLWSNNNAWVLYDMLNNDEYGMRRYLNDQIVDKWSLYEISKYCDELVQIPEIRTITLIKDLAAGDTTIYFKKSKYNFKSGSKLFANLINGSTSSLTLTSNIIEGDTSATIASSPLVISSDGIATNGTWNGYVRPLYWAEHPDGKTKPNNDKYNLYYKAVSANATTGDITISSPSTRYCEIGNSYIYARFSGISGGDSGITLKPTKVRIRATNDLGVGGSTISVNTDDLQAQTISEQFRFSLDKSIASNSSARNLEGMGWQSSMYISLSDFNKTICSHVSSVGVELFAGEGVIGISPLDGGGYKHVFTTSIFSGTTSGSVLTRDSSLTLPNTNTLYEFNLFVEKERVDAITGGLSGDIIPIIIHLPITDGVNPVHLYAYSEKITWSTTGNSTLCYINLNTEYTSNETFSGVGGESDYTKELKFYKVTIYLNSKISRVGIQPNELSGISSDILEKLYRETGEVDRYYNDKRVVDTLKNTYYLNIDGNEGWGLYPYYYNIFPKRAYESEGEFDSSGTAFTIQTKVNQKRFEQKTLAERINDGGIFIEIESKVYHHVGTGFTITGGSNLLTLDQGLQTSLTEGDWVEFVYRKNGNIAVAYMPITTDYDEGDTTIEFTPDSGHPCIGGLVEVQLDGATNSYNLIGVACEPRFEFNSFIQASDDGYKVIQDFTSSFRNILSWAGGKLISVADKEDDVIAIFTNANVVEGKFDYSSSSKNSRNNVVKVRYNEPENEYQLAMEMYEDVESILKYGWREKELTLTGCTSKYQAKRMAKYINLVENRLADTITFKSGLESEAVYIGAVIAVYDRRTSDTFLGGRIKSFDGVSALTMDRGIEYCKDWEVGKLYFEGQIVKVYETTISDLNFYSYYECKINHTSTLTNGDSPALWKKVCALRKNNTSYESGDLVYDIELGGGLNYGRVLEDIPSTSTTPSIGSSEIEELGDSNPDFDIKIANPSEIDLSPTNSADIYKMFNSQAISYPLNIPIVDGSKVYIKGTPTNVLNKIFTISNVDNSKTRLWRVLGIVESDDQGVYDITATAYDLNIYAEADRVTQ